MARNLTANSLLTKSEVEATVPTVITVADSSDNSCFVAMFESATGNLAPKTDAALLYDPTTGALASTLLSANTITANTAFVPDANDGAALGTAALQFSDLFLAEGAVINFDNGDVTITQTGNVLSFAGATTRYEYDGPNTPATNDGAALGTTALGWSDLFLASGAVLNHNNGSSTITGGTNIWTFGGSGANGNGIVLPAGGTSTAPLVITPGTLKTTAADGDIEMDADCLYACTDAANRGFVPVIHMIRQNANRSNFANNTNQQAIFDSVAGGTLTLETGTYEFEGLIQIQGTSATSGNLKFSLIGAGGATLTQILYIIQAMDAANDTLTAWSGVSEVIATQTATNMATASTATVTTFWVKGTFKVTGAGSIIPSVAQTTAVNNSANTLAGSFFKVNRIGSQTMTSVGQWT